VRLRRLVRPEAALASVAIFFLFLLNHRIQPRYVAYGGAHFGRFQSAVRAMATCYGCVDMVVVQFLANQIFHLDFCN